MNNEEKTFDSIYCNVDNNDLKRIIRDHYSADSWNILDQLTSFKAGESLNTFDSKVKTAFVLRSASLSFEYKRVLDIISNISELINGLSDKKEHELALKGLVFHNAAVALGYMGRREETEYDLYSDKALSIYKKLRADYDRFLLITQKIDIDTYYIDSAYHSQIRSYKNVINEFPADFSEKINVAFRIGLLCLLNHLKRPHINGSIDNSELLEAQEWFNKACAISKGYKDIWSKCGLLISNYYLGGSIDRKIFDKPVEGYKSKMKRFPPIGFLYINANRILGKDEKVRSYYFEAERKIDELISIFPDDDQYRHFILENFSVIIEDWILDIPRDKKNSEISRFKHMIHANEIIQNRSLTESVPGKYTNKDNIIYITDLITKIGTADPGVGLIYMTTSLTKLSARPMFYFLFAKDIGDEKSYTIRSIEIDAIFELEKEVHGRLSRNIIPLEEQQSILMNYADLFGIKKEDIDNRRFIVIPNNIALYLPIHMAFIDGEYLYENASFTYLPNIHMAKRDVTKHYITNSDIAVFCNSAIDNSMLEAESIKRIIGKEHTDIVPDPTLSDVKEMSKKKSSIHVVTHHDKDQLQFNGHSINSEEFIRALPKDLDNVVLNICRGGQVTQTGEYPIMHKSLAHTLLAKNTGQVITNTWNLGQDASLEFTSVMYNRYLRKKNMNKYPSELKDRLPSVYGGYMIWG